MSKEYFKVKEIILHEDGVFDIRICDKCYEFDTFGEKYIYHLKDESDNSHDLSNVLIEYCSLEKAYLHVNYKNSIVCAYTLNIDDDVATNALKNEMIVCMYSYLKNKQEELFKQLNEITYNKNKFEENIFIFPINIKN